MEQWAARLQSFLNFPAIGQIGGGVRNPTGVIDIAMMQSLIHNGA
jgi:superfamily II DNA or RNA helicase